MLYHTLLESSRCRTDDRRSLDPLKAFLRSQRTHEKCRAGSQICERCRLRILIHAISDFELSQTSQISILLRWIEMSRIQTP